MGFKFMLLVDRLIHRHESHSPTHAALPSSPESTIARPPSAGRNGRVVFDVELGELEQSEGFPVDDEPLTENASPLHVSKSLGQRGEQGFGDHEQGYLECFHRE